MAKIFSDFHSYERDFYSHTDIFKDAVSRENLAMKIFFSFRILHYAKMVLIIMLLSCFFLSKKMTFVFFAVKV